MSSEGLKYTMAMIVNSTILKFAKRHVKYSYQSSSSSDNNNNRGRSKLWEIMVMIMALMGKLVSQCILIPKLTRLCLLAKYSFVCISHCSIKW